MHRVILANLPKIGGRAANNLQFPAVSQLKDLKDFSQATSGLIQNFSSLLKEGETVRFSDQDQVMICTFLVTAEYCLDTAQQLQEKLKQKVDASLNEEINFSTELDMFHASISNCLSLLVQELDIACDAPLISMTKINWSQVQQVGDQSMYVSQLITTWRGMLPRVRECLSASRKYSPNSASSLCRASSPSSSRCCTSANLCPRSAPNSFCWTLTVSRLF